MKTDAVSFTIRIANRCAHLECYCINLCARKEEATGGAQGNTSNTRFVPLGLEIGIHERDAVIGGHNKRKAKVITIEIGSRESSQIIVFEISTKLQFEDHSKGKNCCDRAAYAKSPCYCVWTISRPCECSGDAAHDHQ